MLTKAQKAEALAILRETYQTRNPRWTSRLRLSCWLQPSSPRRARTLMVNKCTAELFPLPSTPGDCRHDGGNALSSETLRLSAPKGEHILETRASSLPNMAAVPASAEASKPCRAMSKRRKRGRQQRAGIPAIAVDTHVFRVSNRIGLADAKNVEKTEEQLQKAIPREG